MFNEYPYTNLTDVNLDFILKHIKELETNLQDFVKLNTIKYADPIIWNITKQYETNTIVIEGNTGTAYLSVQPVPAGVALTNTDYWTVVFTLNLTTSNQNITFRDDGTNVVATFASDTGDWILWNFYLYRVTQSISINTAYVEGFNIERYTVELFIKDYINTLSGIIGDLDDLTTSDKSSIVEAINSLLPDLNGKIGDLADLHTSDKDSAVDAINEVYDNIGDITDLHTSDKDSAVDAINEVYDILTTDFWHDVKVEFGAVGDGVTDDTDAIETAIQYMQDNRCGLYFPEGDYRLTRTLTLDPNSTNDWWVMRGAHKQRTILRADLSNDYTCLFDLTTNNTFRDAIISDFTFINANLNSSHNVIKLYRMVNGLIHDVIFRRFVTSIDAQFSWDMKVYNCDFREHSTASNNPFIMLSNQCNSWVIDNCQFNLYAGAVGSCISIARPLSVIDIHDCSFAYGNGIALSNPESSAALSVINISNCYFEFMDGYCIRSTATGQNRIKNVTIDNCYFNAKEVNPPSYAVDCRDINGFTLSNNYAVRYADAMLTSSNDRPTDYNIIGNTCDSIPVTKLPLHEEKETVVAAPSSGYHHVNEIYWSVYPTAGAIGWICTASGTPGTWVAFG